VSLRERADAAALLEQRSAEIATQAHTLGHLDRSHSTRWQVTSRCVIVGLCLGFSRWGDSDVPYADSGAL